jgi:monovalent cation:H+ antiporter-2, CPA2 family
MELQLFYDILVILSLSLLSVFVCNKIKIPAIVGFLIAGVVGGPYGLGLVYSQHAVEIFGEVGVILLLFTIGIEFSFSKLMRIKKNILIGGSLQVVLTIGIFYFLAYQYGYQSSEAIFIGFLAALSSTAIILNILQKQGTMDTPEGKVTLSILIYQDLAIVPMMIFTPIIAGQSENLGESVLLLSLKVVVLIVLVIVLTRWVIPFVMYQIARTRIRELFLISVLLLCSGIVLVTYQAGLSLALGAFLAGLIISESEYNHQALGNIIPFKDIFSSFFFVSIGMMLDLSFLASNILPVVIIVSLILIIKLITGSIATIVLKYPIRVAVVVGFALFQIGEFSLILSKVGMQYNLMSDFDYQIFLASAILMMAITPFILKLGHPVSDLVRKMPLAKYLENEQSIDSESKKKFEDHIIVVGYGLVGRNIVYAAKLANIPYVIIEMNPETVKKEKEKGEPIFFGDASNEEVMIHAGAKKARTIVIAISDPTWERSITKMMKDINPDVYLIVRTRYVNETAPLMKLGADVVVPEEYETAIEIFALVLAKYLIPTREIEQFIQQVRTDNYSVLRDSSKVVINQSQLKFQMPNFDIKSYRLDEDSPIIGKKISEIGLRQKYDSTILAINRGDKVYPNPDPDMSFEPNDILVVFGSSENLNDCRDLFGCR